MYSEFRESTKTGSGQRKKDIWINLWLLSRNRTVNHPVDVKIEKNLPLWMIDQLLKSNKKNTSTIWT